MHRFLPFATAQVVVSRLGKILYCNDSSRSMTEKHHLEEHWLPLEQRALVHPLHLRKWSMLFDGDHTDARKAQVKLKWRFTRVLIGGTQNVFQILAVLKQTSGWIVISMLARTAKMSERILPRLDIVSVRNSK